MKKWIKKNKKKSIILGIILVFIIVLGISFYNLFFSISDNKYGNRLDDIEKHPVSKEILASVKEEAINTTKVENVKTRIQGKVIYLTIDVKDSVSLAEAKEVASKAVLKFDEAVLGYYDINILLTQTKVKDSEIFPAIGAKNVKTTSIVWTNS